MAFRNRSTSSPSGERELGEAGQDDKNRGFGWERAFLGIANVVLLFALRAPARRQDRREVLRPLSGVSPTAGAHGCDRRVVSRRSSRLSYLRDRARDVHAPSAAGSGTSDTVCGAAPPAARSAVQNRRGRARARRVGRLALPRSDADRPRPKPRVVGSLTSLVQTQTSQPLVVLERGMRSWRTPLQWRSDCAADPSRRSVVDADDERPLPTRRTHSLWIQADSAAVGRTRSTYPASLPRSSYAAGARARSRRLPPHDAGGAYATRLVRRGSVAAGRRRTFRGGFGRAGYSLAAADSGDKSRRGRQRRRRADRNANAL